MNDGRYIPCTVYLAGPIAGCTYRQATEWRLEASQRLAHLGIESLDPMRGKEKLADAYGHDREPIPSLDGYDAYSGLLSKLMSPEQIVQRDLADVLRSDVVIVDFSHGPQNQYSIGTISEIAYARGLGKPIFAVCKDPDGNVNLKNAFVCGFVTSVDNGLEGACERAACFFQTG